ncbi:hypothetical protein LJB88_02555 [Erysipelotrichaceae bacterium OttesenSCG-928-M19]|nr:hypothetical protein [Erysipelotrichaceae bacterium OttesenSCG-928-M19]
MKRKIISLGLILVLLSACQFGANQQNKFNPEKTNSGVAIVNEKQVEKLCSKAALDGFLNNRTLSGITDELALDNVADISYQKIAKEYSTLKSYPKACQYQVEYYDFSAQANWVVITDLTLKKDEAVDLIKLSEDGTFETFINDSQDTVVSLLIKNMLKDNEDEYTTKELLAGKSAEYQLVAMPIYRSYHFSDLKLINDYDFIVVSDLAFKLIEK